MKNLFFSFATLLIGTFAVFNPSETSKVSDVLTVNSNLTDNEMRPSEEGREENVEDLEESHER
jgi:hypothetical protein